jgi:hypothetical protein
MSTRSLDHALQFHAVRLTLAGKRHALQRIRFDPAHILQRRRSWRIPPA